MDPYFAATLGRDFIFGSADDVPLQFGADDYSREDPYLGINDTLNTVAFGLSTGKATALASSAFSAVAIAGPGSASGPSLSIFDSLNDSGEDDEDSLGLI